MLYTRFTSLPFILYILLSLCSCKPKPKAGEVSFGDIDTSHIAADTSMQVNMDRSYEYQKPLPESDSVVYDFLAYDRPQPSNTRNWERKFLVIRRTGAGQDTIIRGSRNGVVGSIWLSDLDGDGHSEIMFYDHPFTSPAHVRLYAYEFDGTKRYHDIKFNSGEMSPSYRGGDSFFVYDGYLIRRYPSFKSNKDSIPRSERWESYKLEKETLVLSKSKEVEL